MNNIERMKSSKSAHQFRTHLKQGDFLMVGVKLAGGNGFTKLHSKLDAIIEADDIITR